MLSDILYKGLDERACCKVPPDADSSGSCDVAMSVSAPLRVHAVRLSERQPLPC